MDKDNTRQVSFKLAETDFIAFRIALVQRGETAQAVLEKAVKNYLKEGKTMENKTYAVLANDGWEAGNQFDTVTNYPPYNGLIIVGDITEAELEADDDVIEYREVEVIDPGKAKKSDYFPEGDVMGYAIRF
jgi:hypothetical protein